MGFATSGYLPAVVTIVLDEFTTPHTIDLTGSYSVLNMMALSGAFTNTTGFSFSLGLSTSGIL